MPTLRQTLAISCCSRKAFAVWAFACLGCGVWGAALSADMQAHRQTAMLAAQRSLLDGFSGFWVSAPSFQGGSSAIRSYSGSLLYKRPSEVRSGYDNAVRHDVSSFYESSRPAVSGIFNWVLQPGQVVSVGLNSGYESPKLTITPAVFLGWSGSFGLTARQQLTVSAGAWLGGQLSESPCLDDYGRQYWCMTLTAWEDYRSPSWHSTPHYLDFRWSVQFR